MITTTQITATPVSSDTVFTGSGNEVLTFISLCNYGTKLMRVSVYVVPNGDVANSANLIIKELDILPTDSYNIFNGGERLQLENGDTIRALVVDPDNPTPGTAVTLTTVISSTSVA